MKPSRPWPYSNLLERMSINRHQDNVAAGRARNPAEPHIVKRVLQCIVHPRQQTERKDAQNKNMRPERFTPRLQLAFTGLENIIAPRRDCDREWSLLVASFHFSTL